MQVVIASNNHNKIEEITALLKPFDFETIPQAQFHLLSAKETGLTFLENAILKARHACRHTHLPAIADDSGLAVDALHGNPGIHSARFADAQLGTQDYCRRLLNELTDVPLEKRTARYYSILVFLRHENDPAPLFSQGIWEGMIIHEMRGNYGFGYDPLFFLPKEQCTVSELLPERKNQLSHRFQAMQNLASQLKTL